ncbi:TIGR03619 family F420-dependent LLM class oxidoreductase [Phytohabitans suffuscus]|nr:TIGR03619 family F420-dependent LLM class oxidoreductase [Phytohabitans suffuscus]
MEFGVGIFPTYDGMKPGDAARFVEERGQDALYFAEHTHIPATETDRAPGRPLPSKYWKTYDLFVALTAAAAATTRLRVASGICLVIERDPIITAKEVASVDHLCGGRLEFGVGAGWNRTEMRHHGTDPRVRMRVMRERVEAMKTIWANDEASYSGRYVNFERVWSWPKPAQRPHPRSSSAGPARPCSTACWPSATRGSRTTGPACTTGSPSCARGPSAPSRSS